MQKTITTNFLTKQKKINEGEVPKYYVENSHPPIIPPETFELVQEEFRRRKVAGNYTSAINCFASRIVCGECGGFYGRKVWHSNTKYAQTIWQCNNKFQKRKYCTTPHVKEEVIKKAFIDAFNSIIENKAEILLEYEEILNQVINSKRQENECKKIDEECAAIEVIVDKLVAENARVSMDQQEYDRRYKPHATRYNELQKRRYELGAEIAMCKGRKNQINAFIKELEKQEQLLTEFSESLWCATLNTVIVKSDTDVVFQFKDGTELLWGLGDE